MSFQRDQWEGKFGDEYTARNRVTKKDVANRSEALFWLLCRTGMLENVLEVGAGQGANAKAFKIAANMYDCHQPDFTGIEANRKAFEKLAKVATYAFNADWLEMLPGELPNDEFYCYDLVFTMGVLIHVDRKDLNNFIRAMWQYVRPGGYLAAFEYFSPQREELVYQNSVNMLWKDDYGSIIQVNCPKAEFIDCTFFWKPATGLDNLTLWLFQKPEK